MTLQAQDCFCKRTRCKSKEQKEPESTRLICVKKWRATGSAGNYNDWGVFECPNCGHRYRIHLGSGRDVENPEVAKKRMAEALLGLYRNIEAEYGRDA